MTDESKKVLNGWERAVGDGWHDILDRLVRDLLALGWDGYIGQVKEKFGGLRFYIGGAPMEVFERIDEAERESLRTCEQCGAPGEPRSGGWIKTLCEACHGSR